MELDIEEVVIVPKFENLAEKLPYLKNAGMHEKNRYRKKYQDNVFKH